MATSIQHNAMKIVRLVREAIEMGDKLGTVVCCLENEFVRRGYGCPMQFNTAFNYAVKKGAIHYKH